MDEEPQFELVAQVAKLPEHTDLNRAWRELRVGHGRHCHFIAGHQSLRVESKHRNFRRPALLRSLFIHICAAPYSEEWHPSHYERTSSPFSTPCCVERDVYINLAPDEVQVLQFLVVGH